jgi:hypothetical protein
MKNINKIIIISYLLILVVLLSGCPGGETKESPSSEQQEDQQSSKMSEDLIQIEKSLESIIKQLGGPVAMAIESNGKEGSENQGTEGQSKKENQDKEQQSNGEQGKEAQGTEDQKKEDKGNENQGKDSQNTEVKGSEDQGKEAQGKENKGAEGKDKEQQQDNKGQMATQITATPPQGLNQQAQMVKKETDKSDTENKWQEVSKTLNDLHLKWNNFIPIAVKLQVGKDMIEKFSNSLNQLTNAASSKNTIKTIEGANNSYFFLADFYKLFKSKTSSELKKIKYYDRTIILNAGVNDWIQAENNMNNLKYSWSLYRTTIDKEQNETANKLDFSITEMEKVMKEKNIQLTNIKGIILLTNIENLEKEINEGQEENSTKADT